MSSSRNPDHLGKIQFYLPISFSALSIIVGVGIMFAYTKANDSKQRENLTFGVAAISAAVGAANTFYALQSIRRGIEFQEKTIEIEEKNRKEIKEIEEKNRQEAKEIEEKNRRIDRTLMYIARWNSPEYTSSKNAALEVLRAVAANGKTLVEYLRQEPEKEVQIINILNFLEEISSCMTAGYLDETFLFNFYRYIVIRYGEKFSVYIEQRRSDAQNPRLYIGLTQLCTKWRNRGV